MYKKEKKKKKKNLRHTNAHLVFQKIDCFFFSKFWYVKHETNVVRTKL